MSITRPRRAQTGPSRRSSFAPQPESPAEGGHHARGAHLPSKLHTCYNNDALTAFTVVSVGTGFDSGPETVETCVPVASAVYGDSDGWSECTFSEPVAASLGGLYVVFEFPAGSAFSARGQGGGPAIGFSNGLTEPHGWISGDGETWHPLAGDYGFAVLPVLVEVTDDMMVKSMNGVDETPELPEEFYVVAGPNPFNPQVVVEFGLPAAAMTEVDVFDLRGRRVARLLGEHLGAGHHRVTWQGEDSGGRRVSSGSYFLRISAGAIRNVTRLTLVK